METFFGLIIVIVILYIYHWNKNQKKKSNSSTFKLEDSDYFSSKEYQDFFNFHNEKTIKDHYKNLETIESQYIVLYNLNSFFSPQMDNLIKFCWDDINLAEHFIYLHKKYNQQIPTDYGTFKRLAIIYDKRKEYEEAIKVCVRSKKQGFIEDGTSGKMYGRLARMIKRSGSEQPLDYYLGEDYK